MADIAFDLSEDQRMIRDTARKIAAEQIAPHAASLDRDGGRTVMMHNLRILSQNGFMGLNVSADYGGTEAGTTAFALAVQEIGAACASTGVTVSVTNMVAEIIDKIGSEEQKRAYLPPLCDGTYPAGAFCLTEAGAGSDPSSMKTQAEMEGNEWVLNGAKLYITSAAYAGLFVVWAVTDPDAPRGKGISCFLVPAETHGLSIGKEEKKMGQSGSATNEVVFENCRLPASALMGDLNDGFRIAVGELAGGRIGIAALALGIARAAMETAERYMTERRQFGKVLSDHQGLQWQVADRETELEAARLLILRAASLKDAGASFGTAASMAKLFSTEAAQRATYAALQLHGGAGYTADLPLERYARDVRITTIYEGTSEIQRMIIARDILSNIQ